MGELRFSEPKFGYFRLRLRSLEPQYFNARFPIFENKIMYVSGNVINIGIIIELGGFKLDRHR